MCGVGNIPRNGAISEIVEQSAADGHIFKQYPLRYSKNVLGQAETLPEYPQVLARQSTLPTPSAASVSPVM